MALDYNLCLKQENEHPEVVQCIRQSSSMKNALPRYEYLYNLKQSIPKELYAFYLRKILQMDTSKVSKSLREKMFVGVSTEDIMYQSELDAIDKFDDYITVYRGTSKLENEPGMSWSLRRDVAEGTYYRGRLFEAKIPKDAILLYFAEDAAEDEIIAIVNSDYKIIEED